MGTCLYKLLKDIMKLASFHDSEGMQLLSILTNRLSSAPTAANNPKQQQQQNGADSHASSKQQQPASSQEHPAAPSMQAASSQEPGADEMPAAAAAAATKQQQQVPRRRRVELNPARGGGLVLIYQVIALRSSAPTLLAKARQTPASFRDKGKSVSETF